MKRFFALWLMLAGVCLFASAPVVIPPGWGPTQPPVNIPGPPGPAGSVGTNSIVNIYILTNNVYVTVSSKGIANGLSTTTNAGCPFGPDIPGTMTCGIQEAINSILISTSNFNGNVGGEVRLSPGIFYTTAGIVLPSWTNGTALTLSGPGMVAGGITYVGTTASYALSLGVASHNPYNSSVYTVRDMWIASAKNSPTNIVAVHELPMGGSDFSHVWIGYWPSMTNNSSGMFTPSETPDTTKHNLIGADVITGYNNWTRFRDCEFSFCLVGLSINSDHVYIENCYFSFCGQTSDQPASDWTWDSSRKVGAGLSIIRDPNYLYAYFPHVFVCTGCKFQAPSPSGSPAILIEDVSNFYGPDNELNKQYHWTFDRCGFELSSTDIAVATTKAPVTFINPTRYYTNSVIDPAMPIPYRCVEITNVVDYSTWANHTTGTNLVKWMDFSRGWVNGDLHFIGNLTVNMGGTNVSLKTTNAPIAGYFLRVDATGTNLYFAAP